MKSQAKFCWKIQGSLNMSHFSFEGNCSCPLKKFELIKVKYGGLSQKVCIWLRAWSFILSLFLVVISVYQLEANEALILYELSPVLRVRPLC